MTFETVTYAAASTDFSVGGVSAPSIMGRSELGGEALSAARMASRLWLMLRFQIMAYFAKMKEIAPALQLVRIHGGSGEAGERMIRITLNRSFRRKLARLQRLGIIGAPKISVKDPDEDDGDFSLTHYLEKQIRTKKWSRVVVFGLGLTRAERQAHAMGLAGLQGCGVSLRRAMMCNAPLSPD